MSKEQPAKEKLVDELRRNGRLFRQLWELGRDELSRARAAAEPQRLQDRRVA